MLTVNQMSIYSTIGTLFNVYYMKDIVTRTTVNITKMYVMTSNQVSIYSIQ